jgi:hypothetical protein
LDIREKSGIDPNKLFVNAFFEELFFEELEE